MEKPTKKSITDKQKIARLANLEAGRKKRMEQLQKKKQTKKVEEYDLSSSEDSSSDSDEESSYTLSKKKAKTAPKKEAKKEDANLKQDFDELKNMVVELASLQKKQNKALKRKEPKSGGTKIVVIPPNGQDQKQSNDNSTIEALRRSLGM
jgi:hypothetical protein